MRWLGVLLLGWAVSAVVGEGAPDKPVLVLDSGGHTAMIRKILFTPNGRELVTVSDDKTIRVWDVASGQPLRILRPPIGRGEEGKLYAAGLSPDGRMLAVGGFGWNGGDGPIYLLSLVSGRIEQVLQGHTNAILGLCFSPDGKFLASSSGDKTARIWEVSTGKSKRILKGHTKEIYGVAISPDGRRLATASNDGTGRIWSVESGETEVFLKGHEREVLCLAWSPDGRTLATGSIDQSVRLWSPDGMELGRFADLGNQVLSLTFTRDSRELLITRGGTGTSNDCSLLRLPDFAASSAKSKKPGKKKTPSFPPADSERLRFTKHNNTVVCGMLSPDDTLAATVGGDDKDIYLWRTKDGSVVHHLVGRGRSLWSAGWSEDGHSVAFGNINRFTNVHNRGPLQKSFNVLEMESGPAPEAAFRQATSSRGQVTLTKTGDTIVAVRQGGQSIVELKLTQEHDIVRCFTLMVKDRAAVGAVFGLYLFDSRTGKGIREFQGHTGVVMAVAPSPDGRFLLSASHDQTLRIWDPDKDEPLLSLFFAGDEWIVWTPEGYYACSPGGEALMGWHVNNGREQMASYYPAAHFRKSLYRPDVVKLVMRTASVARALELADAARDKPSEPATVEKVLPPIVTITAPAGGRRLSSAEAEVRASARSRTKHPVTALWLLLDGRPYEGQKGLRNIAREKPDGEGEVHGSWTVRLGPGKHRLAVKAETKDNEGISEEIEVEYAEAAADKEELPTMYVLAAGVSEYPGTLKLKYAAKDASDFEGLLRKVCKPLFKRVEVRLLADAKATRREVLAGLTWLRKEMTQKDVAIVFFSGHGVSDADGSLYLAPVDIDKEDLVGTGVPASELKRLLGAVPGRVVVVLDACHAGAVDGERRKGALTDDLVRDLVTTDYGVVVMCSSMGKEYSEESEQDKQGYFTLALLEGLAGKADNNKDGVVYLTELDDYVTQRVKELTKGRQHPVTAKPTSVRSFPLAKP